VAAPASSSPTPGAAASSLAPADEVAEPATSVAAAVPPDFEAVSDEGSTSLLFTLLGGLLVAVGVGALVLVLIRRRNPYAGPAHR
jgi:hypothetical protein